MDIIDSPVDLHYKNGKVFPEGAVFMGYFILVVSFLLMLENIYFGLVALIISLFMVFTTYGVVIDLENHMIKEYTAYLGFIRIWKKYPISNYKFLTVIPSKLSSTMYSRANNSSTNTEYFFSICLLNDRYRNKTELTKFIQRSESTDICKDLASRMNLEYFDYDPREIREKLMSR